MSLKFAFVLVSIVVELGKYNKYNNYLEHGYMWPCPNPGKSSLVKTTLPNPSEKNEIIEQHNRWRSSVEPPSNAMHQLTWDASLAARADATVRSCPKLDVVQHVPYVFSLPTPRSGQNYFAIWHTKRADWKGIIKNWAIRAADTFDYGADAAAGASNNDKQYSQLVWSRAQKVGCASFKCSTWKVYACNYDQGINAAQIFRPYPQSATQSCSGCRDANACLTSGQYSGKLLKKCDNYGIVPAIIPDEEGEGGSGMV